MSRERETNGKAELNTLLFLREANELAEQGKLRHISWLSKKYELSNNTGWACKQLNLLTLEEGIYKWVPKAEPSLKMVDKILALLLDRSKNKVEPPIIEGLISHVDKLNDNLKEATQTILSAVKMPSTRMLNRALPQAQMVGSSLFSEVETKDKKRFDVFNACLTALYSGRPLSELNSATIGQLNDTAVLITEDAINKLYANH